jgi:tetratricopeptide (TPR) repeat protein
MTASLQTQDRSLGWLRGLWERGWLKGWLLVAAAVFAYQPVWHAGYIWDDDIYVTNNRLLTAPDGLKRIWFSQDSPSQYFPLTYTTFRIERMFWGLNPAGYHWDNLLLHAANALLVWRLLKRLSVPGAWLAAAIFALHPVQVESVAWITERKNVLSLSFFILALLAWIEFIEDRPKRLWRLYFLSLVSYALALFSKTTTCTLPAALLLILWLKEKRINRVRLAQVVPFLVMGVGMGLLTVWWERYHQGTRGPLFSFGLLERILIASHAIWFYAGKLVWPVNLNFSYPHWTINPADPLAYGWLAAGVGLGAAIYFARRFAGRGVEVTVLFYVATLSPVLGFIMLYTFYFSFVADHYQYVASIGPIALAAAGISNGLGRFKQRSRSLKPVCCGVLLLTLGVLTWRQCGMYADLETLWRITIARNPNSFLAHNNLGSVYFRNGRINEAIEQYQKALEIYPRYVMALNNLGNALFRAERMDEAIEQYQKALAIQPDDADAHDDLGNFLLEKGQVDEAIDQYQKALAIRPDDADAHDGLGNALLEKGQVDEAIIHFQKALAIQPDSAEYHNNFGNALLRKGMLDEAIHCYQKAVAIQPDNPKFHDNLGIVLLRKGAVDEAINHFQTALEIHPGFAKAHEGLGMAFFQKGQMDEAIVHFQKVAEIRPDFAEAYNNLGAAFLQKGQVDEAIASYRKAVRLEPRNAEFQSNLGYALFLRGKVREAIAHYQTSLAVNPDNAITCKNLAWILATCPDASVRNGVKAVGLAEQAAGLSGGTDPIFIGTLAAAYAEAGRFAEAVVTGQRALQMAVAQKNATLVNALRSQIALYQAGSPFRDHSLTNTPAQYGPP